MQSILGTNLQCSSGAAHQLCKLRRRRFTVKAQGFAALRRETLGSRTLTGRTLKEFHSSTSLIAFDLATDCTELCRPPPGRLCNPFRVGARI